MTDKKDNKKFITVWLLLLTLCLFPATTATQSLSVWLASDYAERLPSNWPNRNRREFQVSWLTSVTKRCLYMYINNISQGNIHIPKNCLTFPPLPRCARVVLSIVIRCLILDQNQYSVWLWPPLALSLTFKFHSERGQQVVDFFNIFE